MNQKHIILRTLGGGTRDPFLGALGGFGSATAASVAAGLSVEVDSITPSQVTALTKSSDVIAVVPTIPMRLIAPVKVKAEGAAMAGGVAWGIAAVGANTSTLTGEGITVAVLDTGIDKSHPAFNGVEIIEQDFTGEGNGDKHGHGTHCAGTIFGRDVDGVRIGVARGVKRALIGKVLGKNGGSSEQITEALNWALNNGANVISMSLGMDFPGAVKRLTEQGVKVKLATSIALEEYRKNVQLFERLAAFVVARGAFAQATVIVAAAGNESERDIDPDLEIAVAPPAVSEGIISVAALGQGTKGLTVAPFSNTFANISGPGVGVLSAKVGGGLRALSGTSMATPHVAGVAALWAQKIAKSGALNSQLLTARIIASATTTGLASGFDVADVGAGLIQAPQA